MESPKAQWIFNEKGLFLTLKNVTKPNCAQLTREAIERSAKKRAEYIFNVGLNYTPEQLVFVDESSCDRHTSYRGKAWAIHGQQTVRKAFFVRGKWCIT